MKISNRTQVKFKAERESRLETAHLVSLPCYSLIQSFMNLLVDSSSYLLSSKYLTGNKQVLEVILVKKTKNVFHRTDSGKAKIETKKIARKLSLKFKSGKN